MYIDSKTKNMLHIADSTKELLNSREQKVNDLFYAHLTFNGIYKDRHPVAKWLDVNGRRFYMFIRDFNSCVQNIERGWLKGNFQCRKVGSAQGIVYIPRDFLRYDINTRYDLYLHDVKDVK